MPILALFHGKGLTKEKYHALISEVGWKVAHPDGAIVHIASFDEKGDVHVADLWESAEKMNAFVSQKLMPAMQKHSIPMPEAKMYPVENVDVFGAINAYMA